MSMKLLRDLGTLKNVKQFTQEQNVLLRKLFNKPIDSDENNIENEKFKTNVEFSWKVLNENLLETIKQQKLSMKIEDFFITAEIDIEEENDENNELIEDNEPETSLIPLNSNDNSMENNELNNDTLHESMDNYPNKFKKQFYASLDYKRIYRNK